MFNKEIRYKELLRKREMALNKLDRAKKALGAGSWHEDSTYELADSEVRVFSVFLSDIEKEIEELESELKTK